MKEKNPEEENHLILRKQEKENLKMIKEIKIKMKKKKIKSPKKISLSFKKQKKFR